MARTRKTNRAKNKKSPETVISPENIASPEIEASPELVVWPDADSLLEDQTPLEYNTTFESVVSPEFIADIETDRSEIHASSESPPETMPLPEVIAPKTTVQVWESEFESWSENTDLTAISRFGAGFSLSRECEVGQLLLLRTARTAELEAFQFEEDPISIVCLVQQCSEAVLAGRPSFHLGVVFVGKSFPEEYHSNPMKRYRVNGTNEDGWWEIKQTESQFKARRHPRFRVKLPVNLLLIQKSDRTIVKADGYTTDISASGISVISSLDAKIGDKIKLGCREIDFFAIAIVRNRRNVFGLEELLHLEFVENKLPIERVMFGSLRESINFEMIG